MEYSNESSARDLITKLVDAIGARDEQGVVPFVIAWKRLAGTDLAAHSRVLDIRNGAVLVGVDHPGWLQRLHLEQKRIIAAIQREFPSLGVRYLHFTVIAPEKMSRPAYDGPAQEKRSEGTPPPPDQAPSSKENHPEEPRPDQALPPGTAEDDPEFLGHLKGLEEALRKKNTG